MASSAHSGILTAVISGDVHYETASDSDRKKLIWLFIVALLLAVLFTRIAVKNAAMQVGLVRTVGWIVPDRNSGRRSSSDTVTVVYYVGTDRYKTKVDYDSSSGDDKTMWIYYSPDYPNKAVKKEDPFFPALICLLQLFLMFQTGIPSYLIKVLLRRNRSDFRRSRRDKRDTTWNGWRS